MVINRDFTISSLKALCIIFMVIGHSGSPDGLGNFIYLFHMPCFFFCSGFLFKDEYLFNVKVFISKRVKGLWLPFVKWSFIFLLFHNLFANIGIYNTKLVWGGELLKQIIDILIMVDSEQLLGGFWFLKQLLYASIISFFTLKFIDYFKLKQNLFLPCFIVVYLILAFIFSISSVCIPTISSTTMLASAYFLFGYSYKKYDFKRNNLFFCLLCLFFLFVVSLFFTGSMFVIGWDVFVYFFVSILGCVGLLNIVFYIKNDRVRRVLDYIGAKTLYILIWHFLSFKLVSLFIIIVYDLSITRLSDFPVISMPYYWILYSIVGIIVPLVIWELVNRISDIFEGNWLSR